MNERVYLMGYLQAELDFFGGMEIYSSPHIAVVMCKKCRCWGPNTCTTAAQAIDAWNRIGVEE